MERLLTPQHLITVIVVVAVVIYVIVTTRKEMAAYDKDAKKAKHTADD